MSFFEGRRFASAASSYTSVLLGRAENSNGRGGNSRAVASVITESKAAGKNHPSFTIAIRKEIPFSFEEYVSALSGNEDAPKVKNSQKTSSGLDCDFQSSTSVSPTFGNLPQKEKDFIFSNAWQFWQLDPVLTSNGSYGSEWNVLRSGTPLSSGRHFWAAYCALYESFTSNRPNGSKLFASQKNIMLFRDSIEPKWEHPANVGGGRWYFDVSYGHNSSGSEKGGKREDIMLTTNYWTQTLEVVLSGALDVLAKDDGKLPLVVGLILNFKPFKYRVSLWLRGTSTGSSSHELKDFSEVVQLGTRLRNLLNLRCQLKFELHCASLPSK